MIQYNEIKWVHLEISTRCNASCPDCPRNFRGVVVPEISSTYPLTDMKLSRAQTIFTESFLKQINGILINGNHGDFVTAQDGVEIIEYFLSVNPKLYIQINTNASARPKIWERLGQLGVTVNFRIDGLEDTHSLYRVNTDYKFILENADKFIRAGGKANWVMIKFDHNVHQIEQCRELSKSLGFENFELVDDGRDTMPVFTSDKRLSHIIGKYTGSTNFDDLLSAIRSSDPAEMLRKDTSNRHISCYSKNTKEIYIAANGEVYPCCWLGYYPTYSTTKPDSERLKTIVSNNNALDVGIEQAINWFSKIEQTWDKSVSDGKLYTCNYTCGK